MKRCHQAPTAHCSHSTLRHTLRVALGACATAAALLAALPATAQVQGALGNVRPFPEAALRGTLKIGNGSEAVLNGNSVRMAPGMRLFSPQNTLVMLNSVVGQSYKVNYVIENSTGMVLSAWILSEGEAAVPRKGADSGSNYRTEYDVKTTR